MALVFVFTTCKAQNQLPNTPNFKLIANGIEATSFVDEKTNGICNAVRIDLTTPNLEIIYSLPGKKGVFVAETTENFAKKHNALVAINTLPFDYPKGRLSLVRSLCGVYTINGTAYSVPATKYDSVIFCKNKDGFVASIKESQVANADDDTDENEINAIIGGFWIILKNNEITTPKNAIKDARSVLGTSNAGKTLYLLAINNGQRGSDTGVTVYDAARIIGTIGAENALLLDGGSSTSLVIKQKQVSTVFMQSPVPCSIGFKITE